MIEEKILKIVSTMIQIIATSKEDDNFEAQIYDELVSKGFLPDEITQAFAVLAKVALSVKATTIVETPGLDRRSSRHPSVVESVRMSNEALTLFQTWKSLNLMTNSEVEDILRQVMVSERGAIEEEDLIRFAEISAVEGSMLSLYLSAHYMPPQ